MYLDLLIMFLGLGALLFGAEFLVKGAAALAARWGISEMAIGLTVVAFGTSMPELVVSLGAALQGNADIALGNVMGSNLANILLILGICSLISPLLIGRDTLWIEIPFSLLAVFALGFLANDVWLAEAPAKQLSRFDGGWLLLLFALFMVYVAQTAKAEKDNAPPSATNPSMAISLSLFWLVLGMVLLYLGGKWVVDAATVLAQKIGLSESFIGLTVVAVGTSLPELAASVMATIRRKAGISVGNVIGSNIFNILWILGLSSLISPIAFTDTAQKATLMVAGVTLLFTLLIILGKMRLGKLAGLLMLVAYAALIYIAQDI